MEPQSAVIELNEETATELRLLARRHGLTVDALLRAYMPELIGDRKQEYQALRVNSFVEWAKNHPIASPPLSDEALSRESFYED